MLTKHRIRHCHINKIFHVLCLFCVLLFIKPLSADEYSDKNHVLVLHSYHENLPWSKGLMKGILSVFNNSELNVELHTEYMDNLRHTQDTLFPELELLYKKKFSNVPLKAVITTDDIALDFLLERRKQLFSGIPIVFCAPNNLDESRIRGHSQITGVAETPDFRATIELCLNLHPGTERIAIIHNKESASIQRQKQLNQVMPEFKNRVKFVRLTDKSLYKLRKELRQLPPKTVVLFLTFLREKAGQMYQSNIAILKELSTITHLPFYTYKKIDVGCGAVGGIVISEELMASMAAEMTLSILQGKPPENIPIIFKTPTIPMFDHAKLRQFSIDKSDLPKNSIIVSKPFSFYETYSYIVWPVAGIIAILVMFIIILSLIIMHRKMMEQELKKTCGQMEQNVIECGAKLTDANEQLRQQILERRNVEIKHLSNIRYFRNTELINQIIRKSANVEQMVKDVVKAVFDIFDCDRSWLFYPCDPNSESWRIPVEYAKAKYPGAFATNEEFQMKPDVSELLKIVLDSDDPVVYDPITGRPMPEVNERYSVRSQMLLALHPKMGKCWMLGMHQCSFERIWTREEQKLFKDIGYRLSDAIGNLLFFRDLQKSEQRLRNITAAMPGLVHQNRFSENGIPVFTFVSDGVQDLLGLTPEDCLSNPKLILQLIHPEDFAAVRNTISKAWKSGSAWSIDLRIVTSGKLKWIREHAIPQQMPDSTLVWNGMAIDITERIRLEAQLRQSQKMEAVGTLAGGIAHDFNNLLMAIQGNASLIKMDARSEPYTEKLRKIEKAVRRGAELTKQLLGFARAGKYEVEPSDLNQLIKEHNNMYSRTSKEIIIHEKYEKKLWTVEIDKGQIEQVLLNLYINARHAMPEKGDLYVQTQNTVIDENFARPYQADPGKYVKISITDSGIGMDEAVQQKIFEPFFTTKESGQGTGLGLASVYGIIKNHGGIIDVSSEKGVGTSFYIYLPASEKEVDKNKADKKEKKSPELLTGKETILLVDDEYTIIDVGKRMIELLGYKVLTATGGREAIEVYRKNQKHISLVILDIIMPDMGGGETFDVLKEISNNIKVLISSGYNLDQEISRVLDRGCDGFIQKPFNLEKLSKKIREIIED